VFPYYLNHSIINTPKGHLSLIVNDENKTLDGLKEILTVQLFAPGKESEALTPILMVLTNIAQEVKQTRMPLKQFVFSKEVLETMPGSITVEAPQEISKTPVGSKLMSHMTTLDIALKHFVNEFFYMICNEDANEVCRLTGFGNAAGLLVMRGMMSLGNATPKRSAEERNRSESLSTAPTSTSPSYIIPPTYNNTNNDNDDNANGNNKTNNTKNWSSNENSGSQANKYSRRAGESEEEHAERLAESLQNMIDDGVVQVVRKHDH